MPTFETSNTFGLPQSKFLCHFLQVRFSIPDSSCCLNFEILAYNWAKLITLEQFYNLSPNFDPSLQSQIFYDNPSTIIMIGKNSWNEMKLSGLKIGSNLTKNWWNLPKIVTTLFTSPAICDWNTNYLSIVSIVRPISKWGLFVFRLNFRIGIQVIIIAASVSQVFVKTVVGKVLPIFLLSQPIKMNGQKGAPGLKSEQSAKQLLFITITQV